MEQQRQSLSEAVAAYLAYATADYHVAYKGHNETFEVVVEKAGQKYARVVHQERHEGKVCHRSSHSFIVMQDMVTSKGLKLRQGDVLKCAGWKGPELNFVRANVFEPAGWVGHVRWTSAS